MHINRNDLEKVAAALQSAHAFFGGADTAQIEEAIEILAKVRTFDASEALIEQARDEHGTDDLEIDDDASTSPAEDGTWVQAWVWLAGGEEEEDDDA